MKNRIRIAIADDRILVRESLIQIIQKVNFYQVILEAVGLEELLKNLKSNQVDLILLNCKDLCEKTLSTIRRVSQLYPNVCIVLTAVLENSLNMQHVIQSGIHGIVYKNSTITQMYTTLKKALGNCGIKIPRTTKSSRNERLFSSRELEVIHLICKEKTSVEISQELYISKRTVDWHRKQIMKKMNTKSSIGIVKYAISNGLFFQ